MNYLAYLPENFLEHISTQYDIVLVEGNKQEHTNQNILFVGDTHQHISSHIAQYSIQDQSIVVVLGSSSLEPILETSQLTQKISIINTASGLGAFGARGKRDRGDISKAMSFGFAVYDPYCVENLEEILTRPGKKYIRINQHLLSAGHYPALQSLQKHPDIYSLKSLGFSGEHATLLSLGSSILDAFHTTTLLQEQGEFMDVFVTSRTDFEISEELMLSIRESEHLRIIADQIDNKLWEQSIKAKLREIGLFEADIHFISPRLEQVTSFLEEYVYEQAQMDGPGIAGRIIG